MIIQLLQLTKISVVPLLYQDCQLHPCRQVLPAGRFVIVVTVMIIVISFKHLSISLGLGLRKIPSST